MAQHHITRNLAAILAADVVSFSRLLAANEAGPLAQTNTHRKEFVDPGNAEARPAALFHEPYPGIPRGSRHLQPQQSNFNRAVAVAIVLLGLSATMAAADEAATTDEIHRTAQDVLLGADYQLELPRRRVESSSERTGVPSPPSAGAPSRPRLEARDADDAKRDAPTGLGEVGRLLLWVLVFAGGALLVFYLANELPLLAKRARDGRYQEASRQAHVARGDSADPGDGEPLEAADRLARQGKFGEAVHVLMLRSLEDLRSRLGLELRASLTSREIIGRVSLTEGAKSALARIFCVAGAARMASSLACTLFQSCSSMMRRCGTS